MRSLGLILQRSLQFDLYQTVSRLSRFSTSDREDGERVTSVSDQRPFEQQVSERRELWSMGDSCSHVYPLGASDGQKERVTELERERAATGEQTIRRKD